ncbi:MAG: lytic transglycosylase domain-containing protein [Treponema sp.]|jgi:soluble lytic murein transglycosylase|nr:lytic transglycosylase domain-containing protein [Treponema sp.]
MHPHFLRGAFLCAAGAFFAGCGTGETLGLCADEARERLRAGDALFIAEFFAAPGWAEKPLSQKAAKLASLTRLGAEAPFFAALRMRTSGAAGNRQLEGILFAEALGRGASDPLREEAALALIPLVLDDKALAAFLAERRPWRPAPPGVSPGPEHALQGAVLYRQRRCREAIEALDALAPGATEGGAAGGAEDAAGWALPLRLCAAWRDQGLAQDAAAFVTLKDYLLGAPPGEAWAWAADETLAALPLSPGETPSVFRQCLAGRKLRYERRYAQALSAFSGAMRAAPDAPLASGELVHDLGLAFQYTPNAPKEGISVLETLAGAPGLDPLTRFRCLFVAGRVARQAGEQEQAERFFRDALPLAPAGARKEACLWYLLDLTVKNHPDEAHTLAAPLIEQTEDPAEFTDVIDALSRTLAAGGHWDGFCRLYPLIRRKAERRTAAQFAWIIGRALEEGLLDPESAAAALSDPITMTPKDAARAFFREAYRSAGFSQVSCYYRALCATRLEVPLFPQELSGGGAAGPAESRLPPGDDARFCLAFFDYGCGDLLRPFLEKRERRMTSADSRLIARAFAAAGLWQPSIRLALGWMERPGYVATPEDLALAYPRPFQALIEQAAREQDLGPELLFGLVLTESAFMPSIESRVGAVGLTQLMPATALDVAGQIARAGGPDYRADGALSLRDPEVNLRLGAAYLASLAEQFGSPMTALNAYNGGMGNVRRWRRAPVAARLPPDLFQETIEFPETRDYGRRTAGGAAVYGHLYYGRSLHAIMSAIYGL